MKYFLVICSLLFSLNIQASPIEVEGFELVKSERSSVREYVITYRLKIKNGNIAVPNLTATVSSSDSSVLVLDSEIGFGEVAVDESITSTDTFSIQKDRTVKFDLNMLNFEFQTE